MAAESNKHVPAWKRIGLKLKYANENPEPEESKTETKRPAEDVDSESRPVKKQKQSISSYEPKSEVNGHSSGVVVTTESSTTNDQLLQTPEKSQAVSRNRRKSVTFTPDTKAEDGFTGQAYFKGWAANQRKEQPPNPAEPEMTQPKPSESEKSPAEKKLSKKEKKQAKQQPKADSDSAPTSDSKPREVPDYAHYLTQFHTDQTNWKFNKRKQNVLLKNALNLWRIPAEHNEALIAYVSGLQGAAAQQRLLDDAENVLKELLERQGRLGEIEGMNDRRQRNAVYMAELERDQDAEADSTEELKKRRQREERAEAVLQELLPKELRPVPKVKPVAASAPVVAVAPGFGQPVVAAAPTHMRFDDEAPLPPMKKDAPKKKTRKSRTDVSSSDESSSDESSSDSDSEVETPVVKKTTKDVKAKKLASASKSETSDSDSSSSESDSSSDSSSEGDSDED